MSNVEAVFDADMQPHIQSDSQLLVALSGGLDSVVLLHLCARLAQRLGIQCRALHVHHGLSANADHWAQQCQRLCAELAVELTVAHVQLDTSQGQSIEQLARDARYQALRAQVTPQTLVVTGQHGDDQLETLLLALKRGSGPKGLASMPSMMPFASGWLVRPLLALSREALHDYAQSQALSWVEDESNQDVRFDRNFLRHQITPILKQRWPGILEASARSARLCAEQEALIDELLGEQLTADCNEFGGLMLPPIINKSRAYQNRLLRMWLEACGERMPSEAQMDQLWHSVACAGVDANPELKLSKGTVRRFQGALYWVQVTADVSDWSAQLQLEQPVMLPDNLGQLTLARSQLGSLRVPDATEQWRITFDPTGLSAHPQERGHSRKLKKLFQEYGVPSWQRRRTPIVMCDQTVVAVADLFIDRHFAGQECELIWTK
ncbi:tRNA lysidine(34) synthetase TilS [Vibrio sp. WXL103]|uniref:tRNA lysidine(34) synthetase TilS n=1 Tax=unclassified Vibrio TaxID=2614977 RepID=UPI003EC93221